MHGQRVTGGKPRDVPERPEEHRSSAVQVWRIVLVIAGEAGRTSQQEGQSQMKLDIRRLPMASPVKAMLAVLGLAAGMQLALAGTPALADSCPNAAERFGASANLPDCRAYEQVTPQIKEDNSNLFDAFGFAGGDDVVYNGVTPFPGAGNGTDNPVLSYRTPTGWKTKSLTPPQGPGEAENLVNNGHQGDPFFTGVFTSDFSTAFVDTTYASDPLDQNLVHDVYRMDVASGAVSLESLPDSGPMTESLYHPPGVNAGESPGSILLGASADGSRVYFATVASLPTASGTPYEAAPVGTELYERHDDHTYLVGILPDGSIASCGAELGEGGVSSLENVYHKYNYGAVAPSGSNVVFHTPALHYPNEAALNCAPGEVYPNDEGALYLREDNGTPQARTVKLPGIMYLGRSADETKIFSGGDLEGDVGGGPLYEYDIATEQAVKIGTGSLLTFSSDGSVVYYLANPSGTDGGGAQQLMVYDHGVTKEVPGAGPAYEGRAVQNKGNSLGYEALENLPVTTPDGSKLLFLDRADLTSFNSAGPNCAASNAVTKDRNMYLVTHCDEAYIYDLETGSFTCVSCNPNGTPPYGETTLFLPPGFDTGTPQWTYSLTQDGSRAFFETENALVPQDTNGLADVYEWENGHIYMLSSGEGSHGARLDGVSSNGDDVFLQTTDVLLPQDIENSTQIYDARVEGGFPYTPPVYGCDSGQCQGPQTPAPVFAPPASATFVGIGNLGAANLSTTPAPKAKLTKRKHRAPKHKVKHAKRAASKKHNAASGNRKEGK
jgi:hypothetical protein